MNVFKDRLKLLRENKKISSKELADALNVDVATISNYESGRRNPKNETLLQLADFFNVSIDYLLGRTDDEQVAIYRSEYKDLPLEYKKAINELFSKMNFKTNDYESLYNSHKYWNIINAYYKGTPSERLRDNDSPTKDKSEYYENHMNSSIYNREGYVSPNMKYAIPYDESKEIVIPTIGRVPTNALDSIAKYSYQAEIPLYEGLGLSGQETNFGAIPLYNMQSIPKEASQEERDNIKFNNRALGNASYFRNYGYIPAEYMVRDFRYNLEGHAIDRDVPPLLHAFQYYKQGKYNPGDPNHTNDVRERGEFIINTKPIQEWIQSSPYAQKALQIK